MTKISRVMEKCRWRQMDEALLKLYSNKRTFKIIFCVIIPILIVIVYHLKVNCPDYFSIPKDYLAILIGYYFSIVAGHYLVSKTYYQLWESLIFPSTEIKSRPLNQFTSAIIGWIERIFYIVVLQSIDAATSFGLQNAAQAIGFWLILKSAGRWRGWPEESGVDETFKNVNGRTIFQFFLLGNALSIGYAFVGWKIILWLQEKNPIMENKIFLISLLLIFCNIILITHIRLMGKKIQEDKEKEKDKPTFHIKI
jgi:hypothetical protein